MVRISGFASGMDIDQLVKDLMKAEKIPLTKITQTKQIYEWQRDAYRDVNKSLKELDDLIFNGINRQSNMLAKKAISGNDSAVSAEVTPGATTMTSTIQVNKLATSSVWSSTNIVDKTTYVGETVALNFDVTKPGAAASTPVTININATDTFDQVISKINSDANLGISAFFDSATNKVVLTSKESGSGANIAVNDGATGAFMSKLGFTDGGANLIAGQNLTGKQAGTGTDAEVVINGFTTTRSSNTFEVNGVKYTIKQTTATPVSVGVSQDVDKAFDTIVKFIGKYNEVIGNLNTKTTEAKYRSYKPLTDEEKEAMSDKQIEMWETKAKSGLLKNDAAISNGVNEFVSNMSNKVLPGAVGINTDFDTLSELGITTSSNYREVGKLIVNEDKLKAALANNPDQVYALFSKTTDSAISSIPREKRTTAQQQQFVNESGIVARLRDSIRAVTLKVEKRAGNEFRAATQYELGKNIIDIDKKITDFSRKLGLTEERYYKQFSLMEQAIQKANQQAAYLMNAFGGGG
jgi:flagellar hook-associated protein 2